MSGTTQNDIIKEYLSRGTHVFPPAPSLKLTTDTIIDFRQATCRNGIPMNVCSYHLQEAGATPVQEMAYALATAIAVLDAVKQDAKFSAACISAKSSGASSFFVNAGISFITEMCKLRAFTALWDEICRERYAISDEQLRRFRYRRAGELARPHRAAAGKQCHRILLEMLAVVLSKNARARAVQLPAWNEALACPAPGTSNGRSECSRSSPMKPISSTMPIFSKARMKSKQRRRH